MKKFLIVSFTLLVLALIAVVLVYWYVNENVLSSASLSDFTDDFANEATSTVIGTESTFDTQRTVTTVETAASTFSIPTEGISLSSLPLTDAQKKALEAASIDVETFILTPPMLECGAIKIGIERIAALADSQAPTFLEITKLIPCLSAE